MQDLLAGKVVHAQHQIASSRNHSPKRSPIMIVGMLVFARGIVGMMLASAT